jgi:hypothetical protein
VDVITWLIVIVVIIVVFIYWARKGIANSGNKLGGLEIRGRVLHYAGQAKPVAGARAEVQAQGQIVQQSSITGAVWGGAVAGTAGAIIGAGRGSADKRQVYLLIDGPSFSWAVPFDPRFMNQGYAIAAKINTLAKRA